MKTITHTQLADEILRLRELRQPGAWLRLNKLNKKNMNKPIHFIVYQGGIANVFKVNQNKPYNRTRLMQSAFSACENYCRGLRGAGATVKAAWCNRAGDIANVPWSVTHFDNAPLHDVFSVDFVSNGSQA